MRRILLLLLSFVALSAYADEYSFRTLDKSSLLYGTSINRMLEDREGFLWLGTSKGLYRYDGYSLRNQHTVTPDDIREGEFVTNLQEDANRHLWISLSANSEYIVFTARREHIDTRTYLDSLGMGTDQQFLMHIDRDGGLWRITNDSIFHYDFAKAELRKHVSPGLTSSGNQRLSVKTYGGTLYIIDGFMLRTYDEANDRWTEEVLELPHSTIDNNLDGVKLVTSYVDSKGGLWMYSLFSEDILYRSSEATEWRHFSLPKAETEMQNFIRGIAEMPGEGIWIATNHRGLFLYNPETEEMQHYVHRMNDAQGLLSNNVNSLLVDSHQTLWVGYYKNGISYSRQHLDMGKQYQAEYGEINAMIVSAHGTRWIGTDGNGLWRENPDGTTSKVTGIPNIAITDLQCADDGSIWIGTYNQGLYLLQSGGKVRHFTAEAGQLPHDGAGRIALDGYGRLWVCSVFAPFYCYNIRTGDYQIIRDDLGNDLMGEALCYDKRGNNIILATYWGLWIQSLKNDTGVRITGVRHDQIPLHDYQEHVLLADAHQPLVWMAHNSGITVWDTHADTLYLLSRDEGLTGTLLSFRQDPQQNVWVSTPSGLAFIHPTLQKNGVWDFQVRHLISGVNAVKSPFNANAAAVTPDGKMLFGALDGYCEFDSQSVLDVNLETVIPGISSIQLGDSLLFADVLPSGERLLRLSPDDRAITFSFYTGNPLNASDVRYSYRIKGLQDQWIETETNSITLLSLPSGDYVFELRAIGSNAEWSPVSTLSIKVALPWWGTDTARLIFAILLILVGVFAVWFTRSRKDD